MYVITRSHSHPITLPGFASHALYHYSIAMSIKYLTVHECISGKSYWGYFTCGLFMGPARDSRVVGWF